MYEGLIPSPDLDMMLVQKGRMSDESIFNGNMTK